MAKNKIKKGQQFPQISRIFNAALRSAPSGAELRSRTAPILIVGEKITILILLAALLSINLFYHLPSDFLNLEAARVAVMLAPNDVPNHLLLVQEYLKRDNMEAVERELSLSQGLIPNSQFPIPNNVLGSSLSPAKIWEKIKNEPQRIKEEIVYWEKIIADKPDYRDAYLQLAILNYQIYQTDKAEEYLKKALEIDPDFETTKQLKTIIK